MLASWAAFISFKLDLEKACPLEVTAEAAGAPATGEPDSCPSAVLAYWGVSGGEKPGSGGSCGGCVFSYGEFPGQFLGPRDLGLSF